MTAGVITIRSMTPHSFGRKFRRRSLVTLWLKPSKTNSKPMIESRCIMASSKDYLTFVLEQLSDLDGISYRAMMGEYILYYRDKIVGGIYDDRLLVKPVPSAISFMPTATYELPYEGAKGMLLVDDVDNREFLCSLFLSMYNELPTPKKKKTTSKK